MKLESLLNQRQQIDQQIAKLTAKKIINEQCVQMNKIKIENAQKLVANTENAIKGIVSTLAELQVKRDELSDKIEHYNG
jgi:septal ring factor EnvC (AmiA/AmiB activator)